MIDKTNQHANRYATQWLMPSPLGDVLLAATEHGLAGAWFTHQKHHPGPIDAPATGNPLLSRCADQLTAYFAGESTRFDVPLDLHGTPFQRRVWDALLKIEPGSTCSYGDVARCIGAPAAVRAVGAAVGRNPVSVIVPCHRVIGSSGAITGYAGGLHRKQHLLALEGARGWARVHPPLTKDLFEAV